MKLSEPIRFREEVLPSDVETVRDLATSTGFFSQEEISVAVELVQERLAKGVHSGYHFFFAEHEDRVVGYTCFGPIACTAASFDVYWIAVLDDFRRLGVGKRLLEKTEGRIAALGGKRIYIETSDRSQYHSTRGFYRRCGFTKEAVLKDFYAPGDDKAVYVKVRML